MAAQVALLHQRDPMACSLIEKVARIKGGNEAIRKAFKEAPLMRDLNTKKGEKQDT